MPWRARTPVPDRGEALVQLKGFIEERYLHQTMVRPEAGGPPAFYEDLPAAHASAPRSSYTLDSAGSSCTYWGITNRRT